MGDFDGQVAWVTGGVSGIGGASARWLANEGARVGVLYRSSEDGHVEAGPTICGVVR